MIHVKMFRAAVLAGTTIVAVSSARAAPVFTVLDLGAVVQSGNSGQVFVGSGAQGSGSLNPSGQVTGYFNLTGASPNSGYRTMPNSSVNTVTDNLGTLGGTGSTFGLAINANGQVTGSSPTVTIAGTGSTFTGGQHAYRTGNNLPIAPSVNTPVVTQSPDDLGTLGGTSSSGYSINLSGQVVGNSATGIGTGINHAFRTTATGGIVPGVGSGGSDLGTLANINNSPSYSSSAYAINDNGVTVGDSTTTTVIPFSQLGVHAFRVADGSVLSDPAAKADLGVLNNAYNSHAYGISSNGWVTGSSTYVASLATDSPYKGGYLHAFRLHPNMLLYDYSYANIATDPAELNDPLVDQHADLLQLNPNLATSVSTSAYGINKFGQVVGTSRISTSPLISHAFFEDAPNPDGSNPPMLDLNNLIDPSLGITLTTAYSINDLGQIAAFGTNRAGVSDAYLLTVAVPEPTSLSLVGIGAFSLLARRRRLALTAS